MLEKNRLSKWLILATLNKSISLSQVPGYENSYMANAEINYIKEVINELNIQKNQSYTSFKSAIPSDDTNNSKQQSVIVFINNKLLFFPVGMNPELWTGEVAYPKIFNKIK